MGRRLCEFVEDHILDVVDADEDILRLEIGMDYTARSVHVIETEEHLLADLTNESNWDAFGLMSLDEAQKVLAEDLKDHAYVVSVGSLVSEMIEERDYMRTAGVGWVRGYEPLEEFDFVEGRLRISGSRFDDFESDMSVYFVVFGQPHGREMAPSKFAHDRISPIGEDVSYVDWVIATGNVILPILFLAEFIRRLIRLV